MNKQAFIRTTIISLLALVTSVYGGIVTHGPASATSFAEVGGFPPAQLTIANNAVNTETSSGVIVNNYAPMARSGIGINRTKNVSLGWMQFTANGNAQSPASAGVSLLSDFTLGQWAPVQFSFTLHATSDDLVGSASLTMPDNSVLLLHNWSGLVGTTSTQTYYLGPGTYRFATDASLGTGTEPKRHVNAAFLYTVPDSAQTFSLLAFALALLAIVRNRKALTRSCP